MRWGRSSFVVLTMAATLLAAEDPTATASQREGDILHGVLAKTGSEHPNPPHWESERSLSIKLQSK